jgi:hypothetical protein
MSIDKLNVKIDLGFIVSPVDTDLTEKFSETSSSTQDSFKIYLEEDFIKSLIEEFDSFYTATATINSVSTEMKDEGIDLAATLTIDTPDAPDKVYANLKKVIQSIGQKSIDQEIKKDDKTGTDFNVKGFIKINSIGAGQSAGSKRKSSKKKSSQKRRVSLRKSRSNRKRRTGKK